MITWEYEDSDIYVAERRECEEPGKRVLRLIRGRDYQCCLLGRTLRISEVGEMKTIWKFPLKVADTQYINIPPNYQLLTVQMQEGQPVLWAIVTPGSEPIVLMIECFGTGNPCYGAENSDYIGTVQHNGLVWHYFGAK